ncbi:MAG: hypothetical protein K5651_02240 [Bacteroidales bacterium]|nr:hypothetical protein [Bacteroidales bacterium]
MELDTATTFQEDFSPHLKSLYLALFSAIHKQVKPLSSPFAGLYAFPAPTQPIVSTDTDEPKGYCWIERIISACQPGEFYRLDPGGFPLLASDFQRVIWVEDHFFVQSDFYGLKAFCYILPM